MLNTIDLLLGEGEEVWRKCCDVNELSFKEFYKHIYNSVSISCDPFQRLISDMIVSWGNVTGDCTRIFYFGKDNGDFLIELGRQGGERGDPAFSKAVLMKARVSQNSMNIKNLEFLRWDVERSLKLYSDSLFNYIFSFRTIHLLQQPESVIREYFRVLKPSGGVILVEPRCIDKNYPMVEFDEEQLRTKLEAAGFRINVIKPVASEIIATAVKPRYYFESNGYRFVSAETQKDLDNVFRLRYQVYCVELGVEPRNESGLLNDVYDEYAVNFIAFDENDEPVGTLRAVPNNPLGFPMEADFALAEYMNKKGISRAVEGSRFAIKKRLSPEARPIVGFGLMKGLINYCREIGINDIFNTTQVKIVKRFAVTGFHQIGEPFEYPGASTGVMWVPMHCDINEVYNNYSGTVSGYSGLP